MSSDFAFVYDPQRRIVSDGNVAGVSAKVNENNTFIYGGNAYVLFNFTTTLVRHRNAGFGDMEIKYFDHMLALSVDDAEKATTNLANILQNQIQINIGSRKMSVPNTLVETIESIKQTVLSKLEENRMNMDNNFKQVVEMLLVQLKEYNPQDMINSLPEMKKLNMEYPENTHTYIVLQDMIKYIIYHNTFHESIVNNRNLSVFPDTVFLLAIVSVLMDAYNVKMANAINFTNVQDLLIHCIIEAIYSMITMRLDRELFILERNEAATAIKRRYYNTFPILKKNKSIDEVLHALNNDPKFLKMLESDSIKMFPFIALYSQSDKQRVKICYSKCSKNKELDEAYENRINWVAPDKFIALLEDFSSHHYHDFARYDTNLFIKLVENFINNEPVTDMQIEMA